MIRTLKNWARSENTPKALFAASFLESTLVPLPIELMMTPMMLASRRRIWLFALATFAGCMAGVTAMFALGWFFFDTAGAWLIERAGLAARFDEFQAYVERDGEMALAVINITPIPLIVAAIGGAAAKMNPVAFFAIIGAIRFIRYFAIGALIWLLGDRAERAMRWVMTSRKARTVTLLLGAAGVGAWAIWSLS